MITSSNPRHPEIPSESLYWAKLDVSMLPKRHRASPQQLGYLFERVLPVPIEEIQATYVPGQDGHVIACGIQRELLDQHPHLESALTLTPPTTPAFLDTSLLDKSNFNLLTGTYEAKSVRRLRQRIVTHMTVLLIAFTLIIAFGLERRIGHVQTEIAQVTMLRREVQVGALRTASGQTNRSNKSGGGFSGRQPLELRFVAALRTLQRTRQDNPADEATRDATGSIVALLRHWPSPVDYDEALPIYMQTRSISSGPSSLLLRVGAPTSEDVSRLADSLRNVEGWKLQQPEIHRARDSVEATFRFLPIQSKPDSSSSVKEAQ